MSKIHLEPINDDNFYAITLLRVSKEQKNFVANNTYSLVHAYLNVINNKPVFPFGIFCDDKPVGFIMIAYDNLSEKVKDNPHCNWFICNNYMIWRLMIDKKYQGKLAFKICTGLFRAKAFVWTVKRPQEYIDAQKSGKYTIFERIRP